MMISLKGKKILITAGPTREYIDPVRYISNDSSGKMGFALASAAIKMGAKTTLITGPTNLLHLRGAKMVRVVSAREMFAAVKKYFLQADIIICAAAVSDFRPAKFSKHKIKKATSLSHHLTISLTKNPDILHWLGRHKQSHQKLIGFALETENLVKNAKQKLLDKKCDLIIANNAHVIGKAQSTALIIGSHGIIKKIKDTTKEKASQIILSTILLNDH